MRNTLFLLMSLTACLGGGCAQEPPGVAVPAPVSVSATPVVAAAPGRVASMAARHPLHHNITATFFWVGEGADTGGGIANDASAWDDLWSTHYGGVDSPRQRSGHYPAGFVPAENPFYIALPYNDIPGGRRRADAARIIPWAAFRHWTRRESMCKNRWIRLSHNDRVCYAQWEDVGPFKKDDAAYVFGLQPPANHSNHAAGIDVSPAVRDYLGLKGIDTLTWQFVEDQDVSPGPWRNVITRSQITWR